MPLQSTPSIKKRYFDFEPESNRLIETYNVPPCNYAKPQSLKPSFNN